MADCHHALEEAWWIYLVRSLGFQPEPSSHDWHVQPSCQRTDPLPPERALSVQSRPACVAPGNSPAIFSANLPVLETCTNYASCAATVNPLRAQDIHLFSTIGERLIPEHCRSETALAVRNLLLALSHATKRIPRSAPMPFRHKPRRKTISLKKDHLEVLANNA